MTSSLFSAFVPFLKCNITLHSPYLKLRRSNTRFSKKIQQFHPWLLKHLGLICWCCYPSVYIMNITKFQMVPLKRNFIHFGKENGKCNVWHASRRDNMIISPFTLRCTIKWFAKPTLDWKRFIAFHTSHKTKFTLIQYKQSNLCMFVLNFGIRDISKKEILEGIAFSRKLIGKIKPFNVPNYQTWDFRQISKHSKYLCS